MGETNKVSEVAGILHISNLNGQQVKVLEESFLNDGELYSDCNSDISEFSSEEDNISEFESDESMDDIEVFSSDNADI